MKTPRSACSANCKEVGQNRQSTGRRNSSGIAGVRQCRHKTAAALRVLLEFPNIVLGSGAPLDPLLGSLRHKISIVVLFLTLVSVNVVDGGAPFNVLIR